MATADNIEITEVFELAFRFATETNENIFLTGKAGTGKTTFLKYLKEHCSKNIIVAAPTGVAAINAGGVTLHSLFQLPFQPFLPTPASKNDLLERLRFSSRRIDLIRKMDLLVIDEISMVRCDVMDAIDTILRYIRRKPDLAFGGVQLLFIGDLYQLPPVAPPRDWMILQEYYNSEFFFDSQVIHEEMPVLIELKRIFRQKEDSFIYILNKVRNNEMTADDFEELHLRYHPGFIPPQTDKYITLTSHNAQADRINSTELARLANKSFIYKAEIDGDFPESMYPAEESLELKTGAQVMFLKNDIEKRYFNGKIGVVNSLDNEEIVVDCDGKNIRVEQEVWENTRYTLNRKDNKLEQETLGTFSQFPLRLAWAITIHKSQGLTFDRVMIDAGAAFSSGQVYVALSRCRSLDGIVLLSQISPSAIMCNTSVVRYQQTMSPRGSLAERFEGARQVYTHQLLDEIFSFKAIAQIFNMLQTKILDHHEKLNPDSGSWIQELINQFQAAQTVALKFVNVIGAYLQKEPIVENNAALQQRIAAAARHFLPLFIGWKDSTMAHPLVTEHREVSKDIDEYLTQSAQLLLYEIYLLEYCKQPFSVTTFLQHKLKYSLPKISLSSYAHGRKSSPASIVNDDLYESLRLWRDAVCQDYNLPIYMVANRKSLTEISSMLPSTRKDLMKISGFGKAKAEKYGDDILDLVLDYCEKNNLKSQMFPDEEKPPKEKKKPGVKGTTQAISYRLFRDGKSVEQIARERNMVVSTVETHLATFVADGLLNIDELVKPELQRQILEVAAVHGWQSLKILKENLPENISYGQLRLTKASIKNE